jgi:hypothetical protein
MTAWSQYLRILMPTASRNTKEGQQNKEVQILFFFSNYHSCKDDGVRTLHLSRYDAGPDVKLYLAIADSCCDIFNSPICTEFPIATKTDQEFAGGMWTADSDLETPLHYVSTV